MIFDILHFYFTSMLKGYTRVVQYNTLKSTQQFCSDFLELKVNSKVWIFFISLIDKAKITKISQHIFF